MTPLEEAISRISSWIRDYGSTKQPWFIDDLKLVLESASTQKTKSVEEVLLSDEFLNKFAAAFARTPLPTTTTTGSYIGPVIKGVPAFYEDGNEYEP